MTIRYDCRWSDQVDALFVKNFNHVQDMVFGQGHSEDGFRKLYIDNIYGQSVVVVVYMDTSPVAARALWRNDLDGKEAYQPGQTCVTEACRGKGIFSEMTRRAIKMLPDNVLIYNFPNNNSFHGYLKLGWKLMGEYRPRLLLTNKQYKKEHSEVIPQNYIDWWLKDKKGIKYVKYFGEYYLCRHDTPRPYFHVIGRVEKSLATQFPKAGNWGLLFYLSNKISFYNRKYTPVRIVMKGDDNVYVPIWKMDAL